MKDIKIEVLKALINHYQNCIIYILNGECGYADKHEALIDLMEDFRNVCFEIKNGCDLDEIDLNIDRPITYLCFVKDLEEFKNTLNKYTKP